jgi:hypothetical protein
VLAVLAVAEASPIAGAKWPTLRVVRNVHIDHAGLARSVTDSAWSGAACRPLYLDNAETVTNSA